MKSIKSLLPKRVKGFLKKVIRSRIIERDGLLWYFRYNTDDGSSFGFHEAELENFIKFNRGEVFLDVGAHVGRYTVRAAKAGSIVYAWEPNPDSREVLLKNLALNKLSAVVFPDALGDEEASLSLSNRGMRSRVGEEGVRVKVRTLDSYNFENVDFIKIDTEGYESKVLKGAARTLRKSKPRLIVELHPTLDPDAELMCRELLEEAGYSRIQKILKYGESEYVSAES